MHRRTNERRRRLNEFGMQRCVIYRVAGAHSSLGYSKSVQKIQTLEVSHIT